MESPRKALETLQEGVITYCHQHHNEAVQAWYVLMSVGLSIFSWSTNDSSDFWVYLDPKLQMRAKFHLHKHCWRPVYFSVWSHWLI